jgi:two-component system CheB/CheR fusion protein
MTAEPRAAEAEQDLADQIDDIVPSYGYQKVPVVGLGGSAGSIEALQAFFTAMPPQSGLAFVVVIHLSPDHDSILTELLQRCTRMRVVKVAGTLTVEADTVYVIPPGKVLQSERGELRPHDLPQGRAARRGRRLLPHAGRQPWRARGGGGAFGHGRRRRHRHQAHQGTRRPDCGPGPRQAMHGGMPASAIHTGMVDWVLPVEDMPTRLLSLLPPRVAVELPPEEPAPPAGAQEAQRTKRAARTCSASCAPHRPRFLALQARHRAAPHRPRMQVNGVDKLPAYLDCLRTAQGNARTCCRTC